MAHNRNCRGHPIKRPSAKENTSPGEATAIVAPLRCGRAAYNLRESLSSLSHLPAILIESAIYLEETGIQRAHRHAPLPGDC